MKKDAKEDVDEFSAEQAIRILAENVRNYVSEAQKESTDAFDAYAYGLQAKVFADLQQLRERCVFGYYSLLNEAARLNKKN